MDVALAFDVVIVVVIILILLLPLPLFLVLSLFSPSSRISPVALLCPALFTLLCPGLPCPRSVPSTLSTNHRPAPPRLTPPSLPSLPPLLPPSLSSRALLLSLSSLSLWIPPSPPALPAPNPLRGPQFKPSLTPSIPPPSGLLRAQTLLRPVILLVSLPSLSCFSPSSSSLSLSLLPLFLSCRSVAGSYLESFIILPFTLPTLHPPPFLISPLRRRVGLPFRAPPRVEFLLASKLNSSQLSSSNDLRSTSPRLFSPLNRFRAGSRTLKQETPLWSAFSALRDRTTLASISLALHFSRPRLLHRRRPLPSLFHPDTASVASLPDSIAWPT